MSILGLMFRIGDFAALTRVSTRMLRHYDAIGLLHPAIVDPRTGYRFYSAAQLPHLNRIIALKELGFGLDDIARLVGDNVPVAQLRELLADRRKALRVRMRQDELRLAEVAARLNAVERNELLPFADIVVRDVPSTLMATIRDRVPSFGRPIEMLFDETEAYVARHAARAAASPLMLFHSDLVAGNPREVEVAVPVDRAIPAQGRISVREMEGSPTMACLAYSGGYDRTEEAVETLRAWSNAVGCAVAGTMREVYVRFGADNPETLRIPSRFLAQRERDYVTEIQLPIVVSLPEGDAS